MEVKKKTREIGQLKRSRGELDSSASSGSEHEDDGDGNEDNRTLQKITKDSASAGAPLRARAVQQSSKKLVIMGGILWPFLDPVFSDALAADVLPIDSPAPTPSDRLNPEKHLDVLRYELLAAFGFNTLSAYHRQEWFVEKVILHLLASSVVLTTL
jgi:hypothetical protein